MFPEPGEQFSGAQGDGQVKIVAAGVHDPGVLGGPGFVRRFGDGQGVHIGPPGQGGAGLGADEVGDDAVAGDAGLHGQAQAGQILGRDPAGALLLVGKFGIAVKIPAEALELGEEGLGSRGNQVRQVGHGSFRVSGFKFRVSS